MPIKQNKYKSPQMVSKEQSISFMKIQTLTDATMECERCIKAVQDAYEHMISVRSKITNYDWQVFKQLCKKKMRERGEQT